MANKMRFKVPSSPNHSGILWLVLAVFIFGKDPSQDRDFAVSWRSCNPEFLLARDSPGHKQSSVSWALHPWLLQASCSLGHQSALNFCGLLVRVSLSLWWDCASLWDGVHEALPELLKLSRRAVGSLEACLWVQVEKKGQMFVASDLDCRLGLCLWGKGYIFPCEEGEMFSAVGSEGRHRSLCISLTSPASGLLFQTGWLSAGRRCSHWRLFWLCPWTTLPSNETGVQFVSIAGH